MSFIDYSQFSLFQRCPWAWFERYVACHDLPPPEGQRDDALAVGTLVHAAIESYIARRDPSIPDEAVKEVGPSPEALTLAREMVHAYVTAFPLGSEGWEVMRVERPLGRTILAKVDALVRVSHPMPVPDGLGSQIHLTPGLWVLEHKTTSDRTPRHAFMTRWVMDRQADFQMLAVRDETGETPQGVIVNVISRPAPRATTRQCRACGASTPVEFVDWAAPACQACGAKQRWNPPRPLDPPTVWRFTVTRTAERLEESRRHILAVFEQMETARQRGRDVLIPVYGACIDAWYQPCTYLDLHAHGHDVRLVHRNPFEYLGMEVNQA